HGAVTDNGQHSPNAWIIILERLALPIPDRKRQLEQWPKMLSAGISALELGMAARGQIVMRWWVGVDVDVEHFKR
ncbi:MAG: hypothetical protein ACPGWR_32415, partial [Ardenticatenaceae bacterium]